ncbi:MAG: CBS domain-containing protein, partial [Zoogloea sp.]|nr:CBS domain-containing protein [Zoogloea sp.]
MATTIRDILAEKGSTCHSVSPQTNVLEALGLMLEFDISALLVMEGNRLVGIFTERDYARKVALRGRNSRDTPVGDLMTENLLTISPSRTRLWVMMDMQSSRVWLGE